MQKDGGATAETLPSALGQGPIERALMLVIAGQLPIADARNRVTEPEVVRKLTPAYVDALADAGSRWARGLSNRQALLMADLLVASTDAANQGGASDAAEAMAAAGVAAYLEAARSYLIEIPDGRVYRRALSLGQALEARARRAGDQSALATVLHRLGTLNLDPFTAGRSSEAYADYERQAQARLAAALGDALAKIDPAELALPPPLDALALAQEYLRQAAELRTGDARARSRKAQGEAMLWRKLLGDQMEDDDIATVLEQALSELDWNADPQMRLTVLNGLRVLDRPVADDVRQVFDRSLDDWVRGLGVPYTRDLVIQAYPLLRDGSPREALRLLADARPLSDRLGEEARLTHLRAEVTLLTRLGGERAEVTGPNQLRDAVIALDQRASTERWDVERIFGHALGLITSLPQHNEEEAGLELLEQIRSIAPLLARRHGPALDWLAATLLLGTGVNNFNNRDWRAGIIGYGQALESFLELRMPSAVQDCLSRIVDLTGRPATDASQSIAALTQIGPSALPAERIVGPAAAALIRRAAENVLGDSRGGLEPADELLAMQMAKGLRFSTALYSGSRFRWEDDTTGRDLLRSIAETEDENGPEGPTWAPLDDEVLLSNYVEEEMFSPDDAPPQSPAERLSWLCRRYDAHLWDELLAGAVSDEALWLRLEDIQAALNERTALVSLFLGARSPDGSTAGKALIITRKEIRSHLLPDAVPEFGETPAERVANTRRLVQESPGPRRVSQAAAASLELDFQAFLAGGEILAGLREQGVDHLCFIAHGPLHYHPLHLTRFADRTLADDWIVTFLPNLHLLISRRGRPGVRRHRAVRLTSTGLDFSQVNPHGLTPLPGAAREAAEVAEVYGTVAVPENAATEARVTEALQESHFVHLATHGSHNAAAPAFQCLFLMPDDDQDGRLRAHEVLSLELRGLDLVTLSACETALGRFDASDNLRGLPAALLLAGASTIIGTLWQVEDSTSRCFFTALYRALRADASCLDAFAAAQRTTRAEHPQYRDWGAFYLMGDWEW